MSEMIDKQNVIDLVSLAIGDDWCVDYTIDRINEMPVVNKEDIVSRQQVIDAIMGEPSETYYPCYFAEMIRELPAVQPDHAADIGKKVSISCAHENDLVFREAAIEALARMMPRSYTPDGSHPADEEIFRAQEVIADCIEALEILTPAQPDNQTNLCDSCDCSYPDCPSKYDDVIFGNGIGNDNICACNKYKPSAQPEIIRKPVIGYEGYYEVDNCGRVYALNRVIHVEDHGRSYDKHLVGGILKQHMHSNGYKIVPLTKDGKTKNVFVHRIVAMAFLANPDKLPCINHKDEDKTNNFVENLEWCTYQYNNAYGSKPKKHSKWMSGRKLSDEHKQHISDGHKRHWDEIRAERRIEE